MQIAINFAILLLRGSYINLVIMYKIVIIITIISAFNCGILFGSKKQSRIVADLTMAALRKTLEDIYSDKDDIINFINKFITNTNNLSKNF